MLGLGVIAALPQALAQADNCDAVREQVESRVRAAGVVAFSVTVVDAAASAPGKVVGPVRGQNGWYFGRLEQVTVADTALYNAQKGAITSEILQRRQQQFLMGYLSDVRGKARVEDHRTGMQGR